MFRLLNNKIKNLQFASMFNFLNFDYTMSPILHQRAEWIRCFVSLIYYIKAGKTHTNTRTASRC